MRLDHEDHRFRPDYEAWVYSYHLRPLQRHHRHRHHDLEWNLCLAGHGRYVLDDRTYPFGPACLLWLLPEQRHHLAHTSRDCRIRVVALRRKALLRHFNTPRFQPLLQSAPAGAFLCQLPRAEADALDAVLADLQEHMDDHEAFHHGIRYAIARAWRAFRTHAPDGAVDPSLLPLIALLEREPLATPTAAAAVLGCSTRQLGRRCRAATGLSYVAWRNRRITVQLLAAHSRLGDLRTAAIRAGFGSWRQFQRCCRQWCGGSPRQLLRDA
ncbi:MAG: AraC family transcriptional regulator [Planctomycetota bacterium]